MLTLFFRTCVSLTLLKKSRHDDVLFNHLSSHTNGMFKLSRIYSECLSVVKFQAECSRFQDQYALLTIEFKLVCSGTGADSPFSDTKIIPWKIYTSSILWHVMFYKYWEYFSNKSCFGLSVIKKTWAKINQNILHHVCNKAVQSGFWKQNLPREVDGRIFLGLYDWKSLCLICSDRPAILNECTIIIHYNKKEIKENTNCVEALRREKEAASYKDLGSSEL